MPRGKNYVNNNKGMTMQAHKKKANNMELCFYGAGCTRPGCIYRHETVGGESPAAKGTNPNQSKEPCMPFLAGLCTFTAQGCRNRHPPKAEGEKLMAKYKTIKCRHGDLCKTRGCLYVHPSDPEAENLKALEEPSHLEFPPLPSASSKQPSAPALPNSAWRVAPPSSVRQIGGSAGTGAGGGTFMNHHHHQPQSPPSLSSQAFPQFPHHQPQQPRNNNHSPYAAAALKGAESPPFYPEGAAPAAAAPPAAGEWYPAGYGGGGAGGGSNNYPPAAAAGPWGINGPSVAPEPYYPDPYQGGGTSSDPSAAEMMMMMMQYQQQQQQYDYTAENGGAATPSMSEDGIAMDHNHGSPSSAAAANLNINAKEFVPGKVATA